MAPCAITHSLKGLPEGLRPWPDITPHGGYYKGFACTTHSVTLLVSDVRTSEAYLVWVPFL